MTDEDRLTPKEENRVANALAIGQAQEEATLYEITSKPQANTIDYFKDLLERAETGDIQGFAIVIHKSKALTANGWVGILDNPMAIIGEIEAMKVDLIRSNVDQRFDCCGDSTD